LAQCPSLSGVWHVASAPISKHEILYQLQKFSPRRNLQVVPHDGFVADRSLNGDRFAQETGYITPSWDVMLRDLSQQIKERAQ